MQTVTNSNGGQSNECTVIVTTATSISPTEFTQITRTRSLPQTIAALLNEAERSSSSKHKTLHGNTKYVFPFWKVCNNCSTIFQCHNRFQAQKNKVCSPSCGEKIAASKRHPPEPKQPNAKCGVCQKEFWRAPSHLARVGIPVCSQQCNGVLRMKDLQAGGWAELTKLPYDDPRRRESFGDEHVEKMKMMAEAARVRWTGPSNPSWAGGVTMRNPKGNYAGVRLVRCPPEWEQMASNGGYVPEHRLVVAAEIGRCLNRHEVVHHLNHDSKDNRVENLALFASRSDHMTFERRGTPPPIWSGSNLSSTTEPSGV